MGGLCLMGDCLMVGTVADGGLCLIPFPNSVGFKAKRLPIIWASGEQLGVHVEDTGAVMESSS